LRTTNGGRQWIAVPMETPSSLQAFSFDGKSTGWVVGGDGAIFRTDDGGKHWRGQNMKEEYVGFRSKEFLTSAVFPDSVNGWALGTGGVVLHTSDGGRTFEEQRLPTEEVPVEMTFYDALLGWIVGYNGTFLVTSTGGATWSPVTVPRP
jgi:photosystem II stability/assembly factor-like uncharacterized protein